jgi:DnaK suppressor protein
MLRKAIRHFRLEEMLNQLRRQTQSDIQGHLREGRSVGQRDVGDAIDRTDADTQNELTLALLQMKMQTSARIDRALARLEEGSYGRCLACDQEIAEARLQALPFAARCRVCEAKREQACEPAQASMGRAGNLFADGIGF